MENRIYNVATPIVEENVKSTNIHIRSSSEVSFGLHKATVESSIRGEYKYQLI